VIDAAAETGTIIELNASAWRLDMDWRWWKLAKEKGVKCSINPDAHSTQAASKPPARRDLRHQSRPQRLAHPQEDVINCLLFRNTPSSSCVVVA
jgi:DNA polymerase (family 10)